MRWKPKAEWPAAQPAIRCGVARRRLKIRSEFGAAAGEPRGLQEARVINLGAVTAEIHLISMGVCNCYLVKAGSSILVDAGQQGYGGVFQRSLERLGLAPSSLKLILLTHGHWDHIGALGELRRIAPAPVAINDRERGWVEQGLKVYPPAISLWGKVLDALVKRILLPRQTYSGIPVDISLGDEAFSLEAYGIEGVVYHTPGHSAGSMSLLLNTGEAFVGDLAVGGPPQRLGPNMPAFAEEPGKIKGNWRRLIDLGARRFYPAHGRPFPVAALRAHLNNTG